PERTSQDRGAAGGWKYQLHEQLERRRLSGAVRAEKAEDFALSDVERQPIERSIRALAPEPDCVVFGELERGDRRGHCGLRIADCGLRICRIRIPHSAFRIILWPRASARTKSPDRSTAAPERPRT